MKTFRLRPYFPVAVGAGILGMIMFGCVGLQHRYEPPKVTLANIKIKETKAFETAFLIELRIYNVNETPLKIQGIDCELNINGKPFATGVSKADKTVPAYDTIVIPVMVYSSILDTVNRLIGMIRDVQSSQKIENIEYSLKGRLRLDAGASPSGLPFTASGMLNFGELTEPTPRDTGSFQ
jgi:LEA14-like dessication related protein